jgi:hypothetical protein
MLKESLTTLLCCTLLFFSACARDRHGNANSTSNAPATPAATRTPTVVQQKEVVTATVEEARLSAGGAGDAVIRLDIAEGWFVNANQPVNNSYKGTEVQAETQDGITPGKPLYPSALTKRFQLSDKPLAVYQGSVVIQLPLRAAPSMTKGRHTFRARILYSAGNDRELLPPRTIDAYIPVMVN